MPWWNDVLVTMSRLSVNKDAEYYLQDSAVQTIVWVLRPTHYLSQTLLEVLDRTGWKEQI